MFAAMLHFLERAKNAEDDGEQDESTCRRSRSRAWRRPDLSPQAPVGEVPALHGGPIHTMGALAHLSDDELVHLALGLKLGRPPLKLIPDPTPFASDEVQRARRRRRTATGVCVGGGASHSMSRKAPPGWRESVAGQQQVLADLSSRPPASAALRCLPLWRRRRRPAHMPKRSIGGGLAPRHLVRRASSHCGWAATRLGSPVMRGRSSSSRQRVLVHSASSTSRAWSALTSTGSASSAKFASW